MTVEEDRKAIEEAAQRAANQAWPRLDAATRFVEQYTTIQSDAFGVLSAPILAAYNPAREAQLQNLKDGRQKLKQMIDGMAEVAYRKSTTEAKNTIVDEGVVKPEVKRPKVETDSIGGELVVGAQSPFLYLGFLGALLCKSAFVPLFPPAIVSTFIWALVEPKEEDVNEAIEAWKAAGMQIQGIGQLQDRISLPERAWRGDSRFAFNDWVTNFQTELDQARALAAGDDPQSGSGGVAKDLKDVIEKIHELQTAMLIIDGITLAALIALFAASFFPPASAFARAAQAVVSGVNAVFTGVTVGAMIAVLATAIPMIASVLNTGDFETLEINNDGSYDGNKEDTFADLTIDWKNT
jgi:uncharacterized protein YukE